MGKSLLLVAFLLIFISIHPFIVRADDDNKPEEPKKTPAPKDPKDEKPAPAPKPKASDADATNYDVLTPEPETGRHRAFCKSNGACNYKILTCPAECPERKPKKNKKQKGCFINCASKCEATCKWRRARCNGYGSLCYDP
nr:late embryogenesis abundant (LEA) protein-related protein [Tanacetum cinerariifolium]